MDSTQSNKKIRYTFKKEERLGKKKLIGELFDRGSSFYLKPIKVTYMINTFEKSEFNQVLFSVPKKLIKIAVIRNKVKRRLREAYRLHKKDLYENTKSDKLLIAYIYNSDKVISYQEIEERIKLSISRLKGIINK